MRISMLAIVLAFAPLAALGQVTLSVTGGTALAGSTFQVPVSVAVPSGSITSLSFGLSIINNGAAPGFATNTLTFTPMAPLPTPSFVDNGPNAFAPNVISVSWLSLNPALAGNVALGTVNVHVPAGALPGQTYNLHLTGGSATNGSSSFNVTTGPDALLSIPYPAPTISSLSTTSAPAGTLGFSLVVNGTNFFTGASTVLWNGSARATTYVTATQLSAAITTSDLNNPGTFPVSVMTAAPGGGTSSTLNFTVTPCSYQISANSASVLSGSSTGSFNVTTTSGCTWTATTASSFLGVTSGSPGSGNGTVNYSVAANSGIARSDAITVNGNHATLLYTVGQTSGVNELDTVAAGASPGIVAHIPVVLSLTDGVALDVLQLTVSVDPTSNAPLLTVNPDFSNAAGQPVPQKSSSTNSVSLMYPSPAFSGTVRLGDVLVTLPAGVTDLQTYTVTLSGIGALMSAHNVPIGAGTPSLLTAHTVYTVGDVAPSTGIGAGTFGDGTINTVDLLAVLRAASGVVMPPLCSDLYDAMDLDGKDGVNTVDLLAVLRRVSGIDNSTPAQRTSKGTACPPTTPPPAVEAQARVRATRGEARIFFGDAQGDAVPIYLHADADLSLSGLTLGIECVKCSVTYRAPEELAPSLSDTSKDGFLSLAWLDGLRSRGRENVLLGYVVTSTPDALQFLRVSGILSDGKRSASITMAP